MKKQKKKAISLFSSGGIGDLAIRESGAEIMVSNEILSDRHEIYASNFPETECVTGDIWHCSDAIEDAVKKRLGGERLNLFYATPPCQGMSKNGRGKLLNAIRSGVKPKWDERNRLIVPAMKLAKALAPEIVLLENVVEMDKTYILGESGKPIKIVDYVKEELGSGYVGSAESVEFADFGVPQRRKRLISIFTSHPRLIEWFKVVGTFIPAATHSRRGKCGRLPWVTVREALAGFPVLDAQSKEAATSGIPFHRVPVLDGMKYWWLANTPQGRSAFDNQCTSCEFDGNPTHTARRGEDGINRTSIETPIYCIACGELLPRPSVEIEDGRRRLMKGFTSAYKRMAFDAPASTLTRNLSYACSDNKVHPVEHRVLSLYESFRLHSLDNYEYRWRRRDGSKVSDKTIREIIGESIPPRGLQVIIDHLMSIADGETVPQVLEGELF